MIALALMKAEVPHNDPTGPGVHEPGSASGSAPAATIHPSIGDGPGTYEAAATIMALATEDAEANRSLIATVADLYRGPSERQWLVGLRPADQPATPRFRSTRCWGYGKPKTSASTSPRRSGTGPPRGTCRCRARPEAGTTTATRAVNPKPAR